MSEFIATIHKYTYMITEQLFFNLQNPDNRVNARAEFIKSNAEGFVEIGSRVFPSKPHRIISKNAIMPALNDSSRIISSILNSKTKIWYEFSSR